MISRDVVLRVKAFAQRFANEWYTLNLGEAWQQLAIADTAEQLCAGLGYARGYASACEIANDYLRAEGEDGEQRSKASVQFERCIAARRCAEALFYILPIGESTADDALRRTLDLWTNAFNALVEEV